MSGPPRRSIETGRVNITNPYKVLQVDPEAEDEVIEAAYRRLARKYHPDVATVPTQDRMVQIKIGLGDAPGSGPSRGGRSAPAHVPRQLQRV